MSKTSRLSQVLLCGLIISPLVGCVQDADDASTTDSSAHALTSSTYVIPTIHGRRFSLCGTANLASTNAYLSAHSAHFVAGEPSDFPSPYWGITSSDAYVCLDADYYSSSKWKEGTWTRSGAYSAFAVDIWGFATDASGNPRDLTGDGVVDANDWIDYQALIDLDGTDALNMAFFYENVFGAASSPTPVTLGNYTTAQYPTSMVVGTVTSGVASVIWAQVAGSNRYRCALATESWEQCWYFDAYSGTTDEAYPSTSIKTWAFNNSANNWVKFDPMHDIFAPAGDLYTLLSNIDFHAKFWILANNQSESYTAP